MHSTRYFPLEIKKKIVKLDEIAVINHLKSRAITIIIIIIKSFQRLGINKIV